MSKIVLLAHENQSQEGPSVKVQSLAMKSIDAVDFVLGSSCYLGYSPHGPYVERVFNANEKLTTAFWNRFPAHRITETTIDRFYVDLVHDKEVSSQTFRELLMPMVPDDFTVICLETYDGSVVTYAAGFLKGVADMFAYMHNPDNCLLAGNPAAITRGAKA